MPKQYTPTTSAIEFDCISLYEMNVGQRCMYTPAGGRSLALFTSLKVGCQMFRLPGPVIENASLFWCLILTHEFLGSLEYISITLTPSHREDVVGLRVHYEVRQLAVVKVDPHMTVDYFSDGGHTDLCGTKGVDGFYLHAGTKLMVSGELEKVRTRSTIVTIIVLPTLSTLIRGV